MRLVLLPLAFLLIAASPAEEARWREQAARVTITRDDWGIAHISGPTDADAVFGMIYAQAEDDFPRVEANYLTALGRTAEAEGEKAIWQDLRARLYVSENELKAYYSLSPDWLKRLMDAWAAGLNHYLATHPQVKPRAITRFEPWMALAFTEGSIGGDIERIDLGELQQFYTGKQATAQAAPDLERQGSNGFAIAPRLTTDGKALLLINPHTSFFFRSEQQVTSGEGLNAYGAATWGQFFIYQGFNRSAGWMHTSSGVDVVDEFAVDVRREGGRLLYRFGSEWREMGRRPVTIRFSKADGGFGERTVDTWRTHHGPVVRAADGRWIAFAMMDRPIAALQQSFLRTKADDLEEFIEVAELKANSSNDTIFADGEGNIAYLHPQFVPRRDNRFDFTKAVDGSDPATGWQGLHALSELPNTINPTNGWVHNSNNWPYRAAGNNSPREADFPRYMDMFGENFRGLHALRLLEGSSGWTLDKLNAAAFDSYQPGFAAMIPGLVSAYDALPAADPRRERLAAPIAALRSWNYRWSSDSVAQTVAIIWGLNLMNMVERGPGEPRNSHMRRLSRDSSADQKLEALGAAVARLSRDFGRWQVPWGEINRFQRTGKPFSDSAPSIPVPFADGNFGSLASYRSAPKDGSKRWYGDYGNSFVAMVEFGPRVRARAVKVGGQSGHPASPHFTDQAVPYATGNLRPVYFHSDELEGHVERTYKPGL